MATSHKYGLKRVPYFIYPAIGSPSAFAQQWQDEWAIKPLSIIPWPPEGHFMVNCNLSSRGFADYLAAATVWIMDKHHMDGIYTDGATSVCPSQNLYAGSGYVDENGVLRPTTPIFGARDTMKRLYRIVKGRDKDGLFINHMSFNLLLPMLAYSDIHYAGEHEDYENLAVDRLRFSRQAVGASGSAPRVERAHVFPAARHDFPAPRDWHPLPGRPGPPGRRPQVDELPKSLPGFRL